MKDILNLKNLERDLEKSLNFDFMKTKSVFPTPRPRYSGKSKPLMTKQEKEELKKISKEGVKFIKDTIDLIKNRKIRKMEKEYEKLKEQADKLAHEIKTREALIDAKLDIVRYRRELERIELEEKEQEVKKIADECINFREDKF